MRDFIYCVISLTGSAMFAALGALLRNHTVWRRILFASAAMFALCAAWLLVDFLAEKNMGAWLGLNQPLWVRGVIGAVAGTVIAIGLTAFHSDGKLPTATAAELPAPASTNQSGGFNGNQAAQNITNYNAPVTQITPAPSPYASLEQAMTEALADPRYSAETKAVIKHQRDILPFKREWRAAHGTSPEAEKELKLYTGVAFLNRRLRESGKDWQITPENIASTFGTVMLDSSMSGPFTAGVKIEGGGGNTFDQIDIHGAQTGVDLKDTKDNKFSNTRITAPSAAPLAGMPIDGNGQGAPGTPSKQ